MTNVENTRGIDVAALNAELGKRGAMISNGYGDLKDKCFRIAHMGDLTAQDMHWLLAQIDDILDLRVAPEHRTPWPPSSLSRGALQRPQPAPR